MWLRQPDSAVASCGLDKGGMEGCGKGTEVDAAPPILREDAAEMPRPRVLALHAHPDNRPGREKRCGTRKPDDEIKRAKFEIEPQDVQMSDVARLFSGSKVSFSNLFP